MVNIPLICPFVFLGIYILYKRKQIKLLHKKIYFDKISNLYKMIHKNDIIKKDISEKNKNKNN